MHLAASLQDVHALLRGDHGISIEVRGPLLELGEIFHGLQRPLRAEQPLDVHAPQHRRVEPMAKLLGTDIADQVRGAVGRSIHVAVEAGHPRARLQRPPIAGRVELLLRERGYQQPQALQLLRVQQAVEELEIVLQSDDLALRHVAQVGPGREVDGRRILGQEMRRQVEIQVVTRQVASLLLLDLVDLLLRKHHPAFGVVGMRQRQEPRGPQTFLADFLGRHRGQLLPRLHALRQFHPRALLDGLAAVHDQTLSRPIAQIVAFLQQFGLPLHDRRLGFRHPGDRLVELLGDRHRSVAVGLLSPDSGSMPGKSPQHQDDENHHRGSPTRMALVNHRLTLLSLDMTIGVNYRGLRGKRQCPLGLDYSRPAMWTAQSAQSKTRSVSEGNCLSRPRLRFGLRCGGE